MDKEKFKLIQDRLVERIRACSEMFDKLTAEKDIYSVSAKDLKAIKDFCDLEVITQTRILMVDTYHIIGMGNLSASQLGIFSKLIKVYSAYRTDIKILSKWNGKIQTLPVIPKRSKFKLLEFDLELISGRAGEIMEDCETVDSYQSLLTGNTLNSIDDNIEANESKTDVVGTYDQATQTITVRKVEISNFVNFLRNENSFKSINKGTYITKILEGKKYGGIKWLNKADDIYVGRPTSAGIADIIHKLYTTE